MGACRNVAACDANCVAQFDDGRAFFNLADRKFVPRRNRLQKLYTMFFASSLTGG
jgi:hypothetical protein